MLTCAAEAKLAQVENLGDVGDGRSTPARRTLSGMFRVLRVRNVANGLKGNISPDDGIVGAVDDSHAALAENFS
jgi:hypothetical protein